mmetsp:Transcript_30490/g.72601  ORF Transcript_30490/g.72601 Transcript_30490/m.72601 type:complete len:438 (+) Transcript_30490:286-1599(+)
MVLFQYLGLGLPSERAGLEHLKQNDGGVPASPIPPESAPLVEELLDPEPVEGLVRCPSADVRLVSPRRCLIEPVYQIMGVDLLAELLVQQQPRVTDDSTGAESVGWILLRESMVQRTVNLIDVTFTQLLACYALRQLDECTVDRGTAHLDRALVKHIYAFQEVINSVGQKVYRAVAPTVDRLAVACAVDADPAAVAAQNAGSNHALWLLLLLLLDFLSHLRRLCPFVYGCDVAVCLHDEVHQVLQPLVRALLITLVVVVVVVRLAAPRVDAIKVHFAADLHRHQGRVERRRQLRDGSERGAHGLLDAAPHPLGRRPTRRTEGTGHEDDGRHREQLPKQDERLLAVRAGEDEGRVFKPPLDILRSVSAIHQHLRPKLVDDLECGLGPGISLKPVSRRVVDPEHGICGVDPFPVPRAKEGTRGPNHGTGVVALAEVRLG